ncbi:hypothetical protein Gotur_014367 [Gossypium turneri]
MPYLYFDSVTTPNDLKMFSFIVMDPKRAGTDEVESNAPTPVEGTYDQMLMLVKGPFQLVREKGLEKPFSKL